MIQTTTERKPRPATCARCGRRLSAPVVTPLGLVGPECERHVHEALAHLQRNGLGALLGDGLRLPMIHLGDGRYLAPQDAIGQYSVFADRVGVRLAGHVVGTEYVLTLAASSVKALLSRQPQATVRA